MPRKARSHRGTTSRRPTTIFIRTRSTSGSGKKFRTASVPTRKRFGSLTMSLKTVVASFARKWATKAAPPVRRTRPCMSSRRSRAPSIAKSIATPATPSKTSTIATSVKKTLPEKEMTGDPQEGVWPPRDRPLSGLLRQDTLDDRLRGEVPDRVRPDDHPALLIDNESETGDDIDAGLSHDEIYPSAEEAAVHISE